MQTAYCVLKQFLFVPGRNMDEEVVFYKGDVVNPLKRNMTKIGGEKPSMIKPG